MRVCEGEKRVRKKPVSFIHYFFTYCILKFSVWRGRGQSRSSRMQAQRSAVLLKDALISKCRDTALW